MEKTKICSDSEAVTRIIRFRKSIYADSYTGGSLPDEVLKEILINATWAPTHKMTEPWRFIVLSGSQLSKYGDFMADYYKHLYEDIPDAQKKAAKYNYLKEYPLNAACMIGVILSKSRSVDIPEWEELAAISCAVQNMAISATSYNLGSYWATGGSAVEYVRTFGLEDHEQSLGLFFIGYPDSPALSVTKRRTSIDKKVSWFI
ncbi:nitroreductase family protein [Flavobacterium salmonis]|uniref:Nitroreductase n=1 Tax=Flavobacterium salmonis TaxID=2654844 RepID=A0A6V6Z765_9FLAO|nr:nitroreductase [Flavobacterium salmonis]CAD0007396.1 nitroreductase [Flavobacterium salmonis]